MLETQIIDGYTTAQTIKDELKDEVLRLRQQGITPGLAVVLVGEDSASKVYVGNKKKACEYIGIRSFSYELPCETKEEELIECIETLNKDDQVHGILVQLPLPKHIDEKKIIQTINPQKDVDGFHVANIGALCVGQPGFVCCTPAGIIELLRRYAVTIEGKKCVVIGRSNIVGKPMSLLLTQENGTVTVCHSKTTTLYEELKQADLVVAAIGQAKMIKGDMLKEGVVVIDVGMNRDENGQLCGDVDFQSCQGIARLITPVPRGVGPMTIAMLMKNCVDAAYKLAYK